MASFLPPAPTSVPPGHNYWNDWYEKLRYLINNSLVGVIWTNINFSGSNITDIVIRLHNSLQGFQGGTSGEYYHLTNTQHSGLTGGGSTTLHSHPTPSGIGDLILYSKASDPNTTDVPASTGKLYKNTTSGNVYLWTNDGGTLKKVQLT